MNAFTTWLTRRNPLLTDAQRRRCERLPRAAALSVAPLNTQRFVVVDVETTGLNLHRDQVLSIGAVVIDQGAIHFAKQFERTLQREYQTPGPSVLIHGIAPSEIAAGDDPAEVLLDFMEFVGNSPLLAFHAGFDQRMLTRALKESLGYKLPNPFIDLAHLAPLLCPQVRFPNAGLDDWLEHFGLQVQQRHNASADALVSAELALILFNRARRQQLDSPDLLARRVSNWKRRQAHAL